MTATTLKEQAMNATTRLSSKIINATRDMTAATGSVAYTGVGFTPTSMIAMAWIEGTHTFAVALADSSRTFSSIFTHSSANMGAANTVFYIQTSATTYQGATITSWDADGFTLSWTKTSTPTGTAGLIFMCYK